MNERKLLSLQNRARRLDVLPPAVWLFAALFFFALVTLAIVGLNSILSA